MLENDDDRLPAERTFCVPVSTGIFRHWRRIGEAIWLFLFYIDRTTREFTGADGIRVGAVYGGKPCLDSHVASAFGCSKWTIRNWRSRLAKFAYIRQRRTPAGYTIEVMKSKKWRERDLDSELNKGTVQSCIPFQVGLEHPYKSELKEPATPKKTEQGQNKDKKVRTARNQADAPLAFSGQILSVTKRQHRSFRDAFPSMDLDAEYRKADCWLLSHPERRIRRLGRFLYNWLQRSAPWYSKARQQREAEWM